MTRQDAIPYIAYSVDDAGHACHHQFDSGFQIRCLSGISQNTPDDPTYDWKYPSVLVGWQCGAEPLFVAVHSYLDVHLDDDEAEEMAADYLAERKWFAPNSVGRHIPEPADYIIR